MTRLPTTNLGSRMPAEDQALQITVAFAPFDTVLPAVAGLFRAEQSFSRAIDPAPERQWARLARLERDRKKPTQMGDPLSSVHSVRVVEPKTTPEATIIEDAFAVDHDALANLLPGVDFLHLHSEYCRKDAERHWYAWRSGGKVIRRVYFHHNYQVPGWDWEETGLQQPWEDTERMDRKRLSARCDRALMLDYAERLGCDVHGALGAGDWRRAILLYQISETETDDTPPTRLGEDMRRKAVQRRFGSGEEHLSFEGFIADNRMDACARAYQREMLDAIRTARSAKKLLDLMVRRDPAPDHNDLDASDRMLWEDALRRAYMRFPNAPELTELERRAKVETQDKRFPLNDLRLRNLRASVTGGKMETDWNMIARMSGDVLKGR